MFLSFFPEEPNACTHSSSEPLIAYWLRFSCFSFFSSCCCLNFSSCNTKVLFTLMSTQAQPSTFHSTYQRSNTLLITFAASSNSSCMLLETGLKTMSVLGWTRPCSMECSRIPVKYWTHRRIVRLNRPNSCDAGSSNSDARLSTVLYCKPSPRRIAWNYWIRLRMWDFIF